MKKCFLIAVCLPLFGLAQQKNFAQYVDPFIGTGGHGHTFPGAATPFGMVQLSPDTRIDDSWDGCSGYHYSDSIIYGFSHTHLSGTGCSDWGDIMIMPMMGKYSFDRTVYSSRFSHKNERANAGSYAVKLDDDNIDVELTTTPRVGFHKYTFNKEGEMNFILDLTHRDKLLEGIIRIVNDSTVDVLRRSRAWAGNQCVYSRIAFSRSFGKKLHAEPVDTLVEYPNSTVKELKGTRLKACFGFNVKKGESILIKISLSSVDYDGAKKNMEAELPGWDFDKVRKDAEAMWNKALSKIEVTSDSKDKMKIFYTALYHCMIHPSLASDADGRYRGMDNKIYTANGFNYYTVFSLWDTFRALHPLLTIIDKKRTLDFIKTFLEMYKQTGRLPVWELSSNETDCMIGYHAVSVIADAYIKGIKDFDADLAMKAMLAMSNLKNYRGLEAYKQKGFLEEGDDGENVSKTLEYSYDDWCIAQFAKAIGKDSIYKEYMVRAQSWKNVFNPETGFMQPRSNGGWQKNFDPKRVDNNFTEGNSWQYTFFVPQDVYGLIEEMGGKEKFEKKLDELFTTGSQTTGREQPDISGLIGQYAHGNEPSHHMAYLYNYIGKPEKTRQRVAQILNSFYKTGPDGLIGNEDCGQMSAWYVMSSMGIYQVCPGEKFFQPTTPAFGKVIIHFEDGGSETLSANANENAIKIVFQLSKNDRKKEGDIVSLFENAPSYRVITPAPLVEASSKVFTDSLPIKIKARAGSKIYYSTLAPSQSDMVFQTYTRPFYINTSKTIFAYVLNDSVKSKTISANFFKRPNNWSVKLNSRYDPQYSADGDDGIIDGLRGPRNWRKGGWQGYQGQDFECVIDLKSEKNISKISSGYLQDERSWILMPKKVEYFVSTDGKTFIPAAAVDNIVPDSDENTQVKDFFSVIQQPVKARYVKVRAHNYGKLPAWHPGAGGDAYIFIDEITIE